MAEILTDVHTHSAFSPDGRDTLEDMLDRAYAKGAVYYGVSEHFDYDYKVNGLPFYGEAGTAYTDAEEYFRRARELRKKYEGKMCVLVGGEFGFTDHPAAAALYRELIRKYRPDFVINSVHTQGVCDYSRAGAYYEELSPSLPMKRIGEEAKGLSPIEKGKVYRRYFELVKKSVEADYEYDVLGHFTYCVRYAPYADRRATIAEFGKEIDDVLKGLIARDKILEINSSIKGSAGEFLPSREILVRYFKLGGRKVSFASDAHDVGRILEKRELVVSALKEIGFTCLTVPCRGEHIRTEL